MASLRICKRGINPLSEINNKKLPMIAGTYMKINVRSSVVAILLLGVILTVLMLSLNVQGVSSISSNETAKDRLVVRNPEYHGSIFANQISLSTDKQIYKKGEMINFTITNIGIRPVHFSGVNSKIEIKNLVMNETFIPSTVLVSSIIPSGGSKVITWNQKEFTERQVQPGRYIGIVTTGILNSNVTFYIKKDS